MSLSDDARAQVALVEEHVRRENAHDLPGVMATLGRESVTMTSRGGNTSLLGRLEIFLAHPVTVVRAYIRKLLSP